MANQQTIQNILANNPNFGKIRMHLAMVRAVQKDLQRIMPERFRGKFLCQQIQKNTLFISVRSSILASQIRMIVPQLLISLHKEGGKTSRTIQKITIRMQPVTSDLIQPTKKRQLPDTVKKDLEKLANTVENRELAQSLRRLAKTRENTL